MDTSALKAKIKSKQLPHYIIFSGTEWKVQEIYINQIAKITDKEIKRIDSVSDIYSQLKNKSFMQKSFIYVVRDDKDLMQNEKLQKQIDDVLGDNMLIHTLTSVDKRTKFYKAYKDTIVEFEPLTDAILRKYIKKEIELSDKNCDKLISVCEHDYGRILLEIDKIKRYVNYLGPAPMYDGVFEKFLKDGTIYEPPYDAVFDFVDAVLLGDVNWAFDLLRQCYAVGEATMVLLSVLYNNAKAVLLVQSCESKDIGKTTGLTGWQIKNALNKKNVYSNGELVNMLRTIQKVESGIKTGVVDEKIAMEYVLVRCL